MRKLNQKGFTLVELMIVVAIIGILSAVAVPNFKRYQAKSKTAEAKIQLAAAYTAQQSFYGDFGIYHNCFPYMGYDPRPEQNNRYFAIGISQAAAAINAVAYGTATNSGLLAASCPINNAVGTAGDNATWFPAGKGNGASVANVVGYIPTAAIPAAGAVAPVGFTFIDIQSVGGALTTQRFSIAASGVVSADFTTAALSALITVNQDKQFQNVRNGY